MASPRSFFQALALASLLSVVLATAQQNDLPFSYAGAKGPAYWGKLNPNFSACAAGKLQSPVSIARDHTVISKSLTPLARDYHPSNATLVNNGFNIGAVYEDGRAGALLLNGKNYSLKQMHWHSPSEHTLDGTQYPLELHIVHTAADGSLAVIGILYEYGQADPFLAKITKQLKELAQDSCSADEESHIPLGVISIRHVKRNTRKYYRYIGSLTAPPCSEQVTWSILGKVRSVSKEQVELLKAPLGADYKNNNRPLQQLNGRQIDSTPSTHAFTDLVKALTCYHTDRKEGTESDTRDQHDQTAEGWKAAASTKPSQGSSITRQRTHEDGTISPSSLDQRARGA